MSKSGVTRKTKKDVSSLPVLRAYSLVPCETIVKRAAIDLLEFPLSLVVNIGVQNRVRDEVRDRLPKK